MEQRQEAAGEGVPVAVLHEDVGRLARGFNGITARELVTWLANEGFAAETRPGVVAPTAKANEFVGPRPEYHRLVVSDSTGHFDRLAARELTAQAPSRFASSASAKAKREGRPLPLCWFG